MKSPRKPGRKWSGPGEARAELCWETRAQLNALVQYLRSEGLARPGITEAEAIGCVIRAAIRSLYATVIEVRKPSEPFAAPEGGGS